MRKICALFRIAVHKTVSYRAENLVWFLLEFVGLIPLISLWIYQGKTGRMDSPTVGYLISYYFLILVISRLTASNFEESAIDNIKDGNISTILLKPISYLKMLFVEETTWRLFGIVYLFPTIIILYLLLGRVLFTGIKTSLVFPVLIILIMSYIQRLYTSWIITLSAFWLQNISHFTPFYYWYNFPVNALMGKILSAEYNTAIVVQLIWLVILWFIGKRMWYMAVRKYSAVGH